MKKKKKKKKGAGAFAGFIAAETLERVVRFEAADIVAARYLPRILGQPFDRELLTGPDACPVPAGLLTQLVTGLDEALPRAMAGAGFALDGYLQFQIARDGDYRWLPAWAVLGGGAYASVLRQDTSMVYIFRPDLAAAMTAFHRGLVDDATSGKAPRR